MPFLFHCACFFFSFFSSISVSCFLFRLWSLRRSFCTPSPSISTRNNNFAWFLLSLSRSDIFCSFTTILLSASLAPVLPCTQPFSLTPSYWSDSLSPSHHLSSLHFLRVAFIEFVQAYRRHYHRRRWIGSKYFTVFCIFLSILSLSAVCAWTRAFKHHILCSNKRLHFKLLLYCSCAWVSMNLIKTYFSLDM